jgi:hypothetical protein
MLLRNWPNSSIGTNDQLNEMYRFFLIACIKTLSFYFICIYDFILNFIDGGKINVSQKIIELPNCCSGVLEKISNKLN